MTLSGAVGGTLLDDIHSKDWLQGTLSDFLASVDGLIAGCPVYDALPFEVGEIRSSFLVPVVLGLFYLVAGGLTLYADGKINDRVTRSLYDRLDLGLAAFGIGWLAVNLEMSILLFILRVPEPTIWAALGAAGLLNWLALDGTRQGLAIALLCGTVCPLCEILIVNHLGWWHYQRPDFMGITSWTAMCYFFYQPALSNLSRYVWKVLKDK